jgi:hypothetical protein
MDQRLEAAPVDEVGRLLAALGHDVRRREPARGGTSRGGRRRVVLVQRDGRAASSPGASAPAAAREERERESAVAYALAWSVWGWLGSLAWRGAE